MLKTIDSKQLIDAVYARRVIWDVKCADYSNKLLRKEAWDEIVDLFLTEGSSAEDEKILREALQKRWKNLRDRYAREYGKIRKLRTGAASRKQPKYIYAKQLSFLSDHVGQIRTGLLQKAATKDDDTEAQSERNEVSTERENLESPQPSQLRRKRFTRRRLDSGESKKSRTDLKGGDDDDEEEVVVVVEEEIGPSSFVRRNKSERRNNVDDDEYFLLSLLPIMKTIPVQYKLSSRIEIMQVLMKYTESSDSTSLSQQSVPVPSENPSPTEISPNTLQLKHES